MFQSFLPELSRETAKSATYTFVILGLAIIARLLAGIIIAILVKKIERNEKTDRLGLKKRAKTLAGLVANVANVVILASAAVMIMSEWGINITPIITSIGILGVAVGFGTQKLVQDVINGAFILFENQYNIGDKIKVADHKGIVKEINLRTTILIGDDGERFIIPNSQVASVEIINPAPLNN